MACWVTLAKAAVPVRVAKTANAATNRAARKQEEIVVTGAFLWAIRWRFVIGFNFVFVRGFRYKFSSLDRCGKPNDMEQLFDN